MRQIITVIGAAIFMVVIACSQRSIEIVIVAPQLTPTPSAENGVGSISTVCHGVPADPPDDPESWEFGPLTDEIEVCITYSPELALGVPMDWIVNASNTSDGPVEFFSAVKSAFLDIIVLDSQAETVSSFSYGEFKPAILVHYEWMPGDGAAFSAGWRQLDFNDRKLPSGEYAFTTKMYIEWGSGDGNVDANLRIPPVPFTILPPPAGEVFIPDPTITPVPIAAMPPLSAPEKRSCAGIPWEPPGSIGAWDTEDLGQPILLCLDHPREISASEQTSFELFQSNQSRDRPDLVIDLDGELADIVIADLSGEEVARWSRQNPFDRLTAGGSPRRGELRSFDIKWSPLNLELQTLDPGDYEIWAESVVSWNRNSDFAIRIPFRTSRSPIAITP